MRILHVDSGREMRGGQWQVLRLMEGLAAQGVEGALLARSGAPLFAEAQRRGWHVRPFGLWNALRLAHSYDLVHTHDARSHTLAALASRTPIVAARRVAFGAGPGGWKYSRPARYVAISEFVKTTLTRRGVSASKVSVVYDGVPVLEPTVRFRDVLAPAAEDPLKGASLALEAARLAGVDLKLSTELERDLRDAALFVYITHSEGLGSAALLAMSVGVPVIASKVGGLPEIVRHNETGLLVENTPASIAAAIRKLLDDPGLARRLGAAGRALVIERFTVDHMVRHTLEVYRQVLS